MRPGQPPDRIVRGSLFDAFTPRSGETTVPVRQRPARSATFTSTAATSRFNEPLSRNLCSGQRPNPLLEQEVEEAAMPGQPARARAHFRFPPAIHPRELPAATSVTAIIVRQALRVPTFSLHPLCARMLRPATEKPCARVNKLWRIRLPCGRLRKKRRKSRERNSGHWIAKDLHAVKGIAARTRDRRRPVPTGTTLQTTRLRDRLYFAGECNLTANAKIFREICQFGKEKRRSRNHALPKFSLRL